MRRHPYLVVFFIGWIVSFLLIIAGPASWPHGFVTGLGFSLGAGAVPIAAGWITIASKPSVEPQARLGRALVVVVVGLAILAGLIWGAASY
jgi:drug/metabolite transporter (DMT)-like permease